MSGMLRNATGKIICLGRATMLPVGLAAILVAGCFEQIEGYEDGSLVAQDSDSNGSAIVTFSGMLWGGPSSCFSFTRLLTQFG